MRKRFLHVLILLLALTLGAFLPAQADGAQPAMTINGSTENITLAFNESPMIRVLVPDGATALCVEGERINRLDGSALDPEDEHQEWNEFYDRNRLRQVIDLQRDFFDTGIWRVTAKYLTDAYDDGADLSQGYAWTTLATVDVAVSNWEARLNAPVLTLAASSVQQGEWIRATVNSFQQKDEWYWYELARMDEDSGDWGEWFDHTDLTLKEGVTNTFAVPTVGLEPGTYRLWLRTEAVGYEDAGAFKTFIVTENTALEDGLYLSADTVPAGMRMAIGMRATGADRMMMYAERNGDINWQMDTGFLQGEAAVWFTDFGTPGTYHLTLLAFEGEDSRVVDTAELTVTASDDLAKPAFSGFPGILQSGQELNGTIIVDSRTERYGIELSCTTDDGDWVNLYETYESDNSGGTVPINLPGALFARSGRYQLHIHTYADDCADSFDNYWFICSPSTAGSSATLTVNGSTEDLTITSGQDAHIRINAPGATAARVHMAGFWEYRSSPDEFSFDWGFGGGDYALVAEITTAEPVWNEEGFDWGSFSWNDLDWNTHSNTVMLHVENPNGRLDPPAVTLEETTVARGEWIRAAVELPDHGEWHWASVSRVIREDYGRKWTEHVMDLDTSDPQVYDFPTVSLEPGEYCLTVSAGAPGWENSETSVLFTVTEPASALPDVRLYIPSDTILTSTNITFHAWAEHADYMEVIVSWTENPGWENRYEAYEDWDSWNWSSSESGTYIFHLEAWQDGESLGEDSFTLTVNAPYGTLADPVAENLPAVMPVNTALNASFVPDQNATDYGVHLVYRGPDGYWWEDIYDTWRHADETGATELSFPAEAFDRAGVYQLEVHITGRGWNGGHMDRQILVIDGGTDQGLVVTVNGGSDEDFLLHQNVPVTVTAPEGVTAVRLWSTHRNGWEYDADVDDGLEWYWGFHGAGEETLVAQATTDASVTEWRENHDGMWDFDWDEVDWTYTSEPVTVHVLYYGDLDDPEVTFPNGTTVEHGQMLQVGIEPVENAWSYGVQIRRADDDNWYWLFDQDYPLNETTVLSVPTMMLQPGDYMLHVDPRCYGWHGNSAAYPITVTESTSQEPVFGLYIPRDTIMTSEDIELYGFAEGADHLEINVTWVGNPGWENRMSADSEWTHWCWSSSESGTYLFRLEAWCGEESIGTDSFTLTVEAPYGKLDDPLLEDVPMTMPVNTALNASYVLDEHAQSCGVHLSYRGPDGWGWDTIYDRWTSARQPGVGTISFPAETFERAGVYQLEVHTNATGWDGGHANYAILVTETGLTQNLTVHVNNDSDDDILIHQNVPIDVTVPDGVTAVRLWTTSDDSWNYCVNQDGVEWFLSFHRGGTETVVAQATTDPAVLEWLDEHYGNMDEFDWHEVDWTLTSGPVTVDVISHGDLENPAVTFPNGTTVERGQMLLFELEPVENAYSYGVQIYRAGENFGERLVDMDYPLTKTTLISIPTVRLPAGEYEMMIDPRNWGWQGYSVSYPFTVTEDNWTDEPSFVVSSTSLLTKQEVVYSIYAPGAEEVAFCSESMEEGMWDSDWAETLTGKYPLNWVRTYHFLAFARYPGEEEWQQIGETQNVEVTAPYGPLGLTVDAPESIGTSDVLTIDIGVDFLNTTGTTDCFISPLDDHEFEPDIAEEYDEDGIHHVVYQVEAGGLRTGAYLLTVYAFPNDPGYEIAIYDGQITVTDSAVEATLTVNPNPAEIFDDVHFDLQAPGATAVAMYGTLNEMGWVYEIGDTLQYDETAWWEAAHYVYGVYTTEPIDPEQEGFDWGNVHWEGSTGMIRLDINPPSNELEEMNVTVDRTTVKRGEKIQVTILNDNPGLDVSYGANLQPEDDQSYGGVLAWYGPEPDAPKVIWVDTLEAEPGEYSLLISANAHSCHGVSTRIPITVTEADDGAHLSIRDTNVETGNMLRAYGYASGAVQMNLNVTFENGTWGSSYSQMKDEWLDVEVFAGEHPDTMIVELIATYADGTTETVTKTIDVAAPNGPVHPAIRLDSPWQPGLDLDFTVTVEAEAQYVAFVQEPGAEEAVFAQFVPQGSPSRQFHLEGSEYAFEPGRAYEIRVVAAGTGYDGRETWIRISQSAELSTLTLPPALRIIGEEAFAGTAAQRIIVPAGVTAIGSNAFTDCPNLVELVLPEGITSFAADALGTSGPVFVYGAAGSYLEDYAAAVDNLIFIPID